MTILEALIRLRNDLKLWVTNNIRALNEQIEAKAGKIVAGESFLVDETSTQANEGAEIFNDYTNNIATGSYSHAEGSKTLASGHSSHAEGMQTKSTGSSSHAEGFNTNAFGNLSHAEGGGTYAGGYASHAEGSTTAARGDYSHSEGRLTSANGEYAHAEGYNTHASSKYQHVQGKYNIEDENEVYAHIVGNGESGALSNAHTVDWSGNAWFAGDVYVGGTSQNDGEQLATINDIAIFTGDDIVESTVPINADTLGGYTAEQLLTGGSITVDSVLSTTSTNPVQNKVIASAIGDISSALNAILGI